MRKSNIHKDKRGVYYYQTWSYYNTSGSKKKRVVKYIGKKTPKEVKVLQKEWDKYFDDIDKYGGNKNPFTTPPRPLSKLIDEYKYYQQDRFNLKEISKTTYRFNVDNTRLFLEYVLENFGDVLIHRVSTKTINDYKNYRQDKGLSPNTISINIRTLRPFFKWCIGRKYISVNPCDDVKLPTYKSRVITEIPMGEDWERLYDFCKNSLTFTPKGVYAKRHRVGNQHIRSNKWDWFNHNDWFKYMVYIMVNTGMRGGEVRIIKWTKGENDTPNQPESYVYLNRGMDKLCIYFKGTYGEIPLTNDLQDVFKKLKKTRGDNTYVFQNQRTGGPYQKRYFTKCFSKLCSGLGLVDQLQHPLDTPHSIRHGVVSRLIGQGVDMFKIQKLLRHSSIRTTLDIYGHLQQEDLTKTMDLLR